jgi:hypothetical protein
MREFAEALRTVRDKRLFRDTYPTFEQYCRERWGISKTHCNRLIQASEVSANVAPIGVTPKESQARELSKLPADQQASAWQETLDRTDGHPTAAAVHEVVAERLKPAPIEPEIVDEPAPCPNCGSTARTDDGDCAECYDPCENAEPAEPAPNHIGEFKSAFRDLVAALREECPYLNANAIGDIVAEVLGEIEE